MHDATSRRPRGSSPVAAGASAGSAAGVVALACLVVACGDDGTGGATSGGGGGGGATTGAMVTTGSTTTGDGGGATSAQAGAGGEGAGSSSGSTGSGGEAPELAEQHVVGRTEVGDGGRHTFSWSATSFRARIDGAAPAVTLDGAPGVWFQVVVDGAPLATFETSGGLLTYPLGELGPGPHDVEIVRRNEGFFGDVTFVGLDGGTLVPSPARERRLLFVGDSLTAGYGIEGSDPCDFSGATESAFDAYAMVAARALAADAHVIAYSGKGVVQNYGGDTTEPMPELWTRTLTNDPGSAWDFGRFSPHAVVVNLGTNDFSAPIDDGTFVAGYAAFLGEIRARHGDAPILAVTWAHWGAGREALVAEAVAATGDPAVSTTRFAIHGDEGLGCDGHTNLVTNARLGAELSATLRDLLGW